MSEEMINFTVPCEVEANGKPAYATKGSAGVDLKAMGDYVVRPGQRKLIKTGLKIALPEGYEAQVRPRSGLALKRGITVLNTPGTIDSDYRGDIGVILLNTGESEFRISNGDRIAQMVIAKYERVEFCIVSDIGSTSRGENGFGSSGVQD